MLDQVLDVFGVVPDYDLNIMKDQQDLFDITTSILNKVRNVLKKVKPDVVLVHGDTSTAFAAALAEQELGNNNRIHIIEPLDVVDCHNFEARSFLCLTDSGGIQEECPSYGVASIPTFVYFIIYAMQGILFLSGLAYEPAVLPMQVIMPTVLFIGITNIFGIQMLVPMGKEKHVLYSEIIGAIIDLILNAILIPRYAALGAAIGTLVAEIGVLVYQIYAVRMELPYFTVKMNMVRYFAATGMAALACLWVKRFAFSNFVALCLSGITFFGVYILCLVVMKDEMVDLGMWRRKQE